MKSGENIIRILDSKNMDSYLDDWRCDRQLTALYQMKKAMDGEIAKKADSVVYDGEDNSVQLTSDGTPIGEKAYLGN